MFFFAAADKRARVVTIRSAYLGKPWQCTSPLPQLHFSQALFELVAPDTSSTLGSSGSASRTSQSICIRVHLALTTCSFSARPGWEGLKGGDLEPRSYGPKSQLRTTN